MPSPSEKVDYDNLPESSHEAVHKARDAAQALEVAREVQRIAIADEVAARTAAVARDLAKSNAGLEDRITKSVIESIRDVIGSRMQVVKPDDVSVILAKMSKDIEYMLQRMGIIENKMTKDLVSEATYTAKIKELEEKIGEVRRGVLWAGCLIIASFIAAVGSIVYVPHV